MVIENRDLVMCYEFINLELINFCFPNEGTFWKQSFHKLLISRLLNSEP